MNNLIAQQNTVRAALRDKRGSVMVIALGITAILITMAITISAVALMAFRSTGDIARANQAYYAAEAGIEEALYHLAGHKAGFQESAQYTLSNNKSNYNWRIDSRLSELPESGKGSGANANFNFLPRNSKLVISLFNDISCDNGNQACSLNTSLTENVTGFDIQIYQLDDGIDLNTVLAGDTRVTEIRCDNEAPCEMAGIELYQEDSLVSTGDLDIGRVLSATTDLSFVDLNVNGIWDPGEPVYKDGGSSGISDGMASAGDIRINTIAPNFHTCRQAYQPRRKPIDISDIRVSPGHCDSNGAMLGIDNDRDRSRDEDPLDGIDNDDDGRIDEDPASWPLTQRVFYIPSGLSSEYSYQKANIDVYANSPAVSWTISGKKEQADGSFKEKIAKSYYILKNELHSQDILSLLGHNKFSEISTTDITNISNILRELHDPRLSLFTPLKGINYRVSLPATNSSRKLARDMMVIDSIGRSGDTKQQLQTQIQQVESIPIFNFTITF